MASSAFKSTTRRLSVAGGGGDGADDSFSSSSSNSKAHLRRSRSLSRFSRRLPSSELEEETPPNYRVAPKGKFVNTVRGSGVPEISLDDLALEFFSSQENDSYDDRSSKNGKIGNDDAVNSGQRGRSRSVKRDSEIGRWASETASSIRRGRSVSRHLREPGEEKKVISHGSRGRAANSEATSRRRRSLSVARYGRIDSESDADHFQSSHSHRDVKNVDSRNGQVLKTSASADRRSRKSHSQRELSHLLDGYSSQSSALTDDEIKDVRSGKSRDVRTIRTVYSQKAENPTEGATDGGLYEVMRKELMHAVKEIRTELQQAMVKNDETTGSNISLEFSRSDGLRDLSAIKRSYTTKMEQSQKRKQDLLAEVLLEDQRGRELSEIVKDFLPEAGNFAQVQKTPLARKTTDRNRMSNGLLEEAERYFEDFLSNVEDTDISSFDGERSDGSSTLGGTIKPKGSIFGVTESFQSPAESNFHTGEMDGVILPWLQWETSNDGSLKDKNKLQTPITPKTLQWEAEQEEINLKEDPSKYSISSHASSNSGLINVHLPGKSSDFKGKDAGSRIGQRSSFDMYDHHVLRNSEEILFEMYKERHQIHSGGLLLCCDVL